MWAWQPTKPASTVTATRGRVSFAELEVPFVPTRGRLSWAELEVPEFLSAEPRAPRDDHSESEGSEYIGGLFPDRADETAVRYNYYGFGGKDL